MADAGTDRSEVACVNEATFKIELKVRSKLCKIEVPVQLPYPEKKICELAQLIVTSFKLPIFVVDEITVKLDNFIKKENHQARINSIKYDPEKMDERIAKWEKGYREETLQYSSPEVVGDSEVFAEAYHFLVHSPLLGTVLRKECALNSTIREMHRIKYQELANLTEKQTKEMANVIASLNHTDTNNSTRDVNSLAAFHFDDIHLVRTRHESLIESENIKQKREFRDWILATFEEYYLQAEESPVQDKRVKKKHSVRFDDALMISYGEEEDERSRHDDHMLQESFTIHLGSQMKQMYNIRLLSCHPIDFFRFKNESSRGISPQRLQNAISIYSADLSGVVLLVEPDCSYYSGITKDLIQLCQQTTEFHFDTVDTQLGTRPKDLKPGDFFVSKHSNLNGVQVIFHLVVDTDALNKLELNSRDPVILGLRNILKTACLHDITTITIPALLSHEMADFMTVQWCSRRAELVYKCVKGFMIEMTSWGGADMKNLQFLAPKGICESIFNRLADMLPNVFRVSNPLRLTSSSSAHSLQFN